MLHLSLADSSFNFQARVSYLSRGSETFDPNRVTPAPINLQPKSGDSNRPVYCFFEVHGVGGNENEKRTGAKGTGGRSGWMETRTRTENERGTRATKGGEGGGV